MSEAWWALFQTCFQQLPVDAELNRWSLFAVMAPRDWTTVRSQRAEAFMVGLSDHERALSRQRARLILWENASTFAGDADSIVPIG